MRRRDFLKVIPLAALTPTSFAQTGKYLTVTYQLFGPVHQGAVLTAWQMPGWYWPGSVLTGSTKNFQFAAPHPQPLYASWRLLWVPYSQNSGARLVSFDNGPSNIQTLLEIPGTDYANPRNDAFPFTVGFQALVAARRETNIGFQMRGDKWDVYESRLEIIWSL